MLALEMKQVEARNAITCGALKETVSNGVNVNLCVGDNVYIFFLSDTGKPKRILPPKKICHLATELTLISNGEILKLSIITGEKNSSPFSFKSFVCVLRFSRNIQEKILRLL